MSNHPQPDPLSAAPADPPHNDDIAQHEHLTTPTTPTNPATNGIDLHHTPARPGVNAAQLGPRPPQDKDLRPLFTGVEKMQHNLHQVSLDEMFKTYLNYGGDPTAEDLATFTYDDESRLGKVAKEADLGPMICAMGQSVADRAGKTILFRDISAARPRSSNQVSNSRKRKPKDGEDSSAVRNDSEQNNDAPSHGTTPDVAIYLNNDRTNTLFVIKPEDYQKRAGKKEKEKANEKEKDETFGARQDWVGHRSWSDIVAFFEAKIDHNSSAFEFAHPSTRFIRDDTDGGEKSLGQFLEYLAQVLAHQHRTHLFAVYLFKNQARLVYADRSGAVVSEPFFYGTRDHSTLHVFFWKLARMSNKERGFDETATLAADADIRAMREYAATAPTEYLKAQAYYALSWDPTAKEGKQLKSFEWPMHKLSVGDRTVFVGRPSFATHSLFGRCTRGYVAFEKVEKDNEVYDRLHNEGAGDHVPTSLAAGDVPVVDEPGSTQLTRLHDIGERRHHPRAHYRILIAEVYRPLSDFSDFRQLAELLRDALQAHKDAWEKAGVLHRDISFNNILIHEVVEDKKTVRKGILSDWDLSKYKEDMMSGTEPRQPDRTGTWYFRSAVLGRYPRKPYAASDDIESFIHVYHYSVLRFHRTNMTESLRDHISLIYERAVIRAEDGAHLGSTSKFDNMCMAIPFIKPEDNPVLGLVLEKFAELYSQHYATIDEAEFGRKYNPGVNATGAAARPASEEDQDDGEDSSEDEDYIQQFKGSRQSHALPPAKKTLEDHSELLELFSEIGTLKWRRRELSRSVWDLFKVAGLAPRGNNGFSSSTQTQGLSSQDATHVEKKRRANTGSALPSVGESQEPADLEG
ncbi:hypothetical protein GSI_03072 [Ganoderma sinense ZZ0214-1]|uniref:Fungal-type protein kinase domain-containing protein n=1 Tax=Ganoderma sinense ZZ0214-1 TaxID=1077348 RepID=A0A2G8SKM4_9APHY|nr:hypothetical protein GSI_03072 [Ganoderma sinense ZZ0214-1]